MQVGILAYKVSYVTQLKKTMGPSDQLHLFRLRIANSVNIMSGIEFLGLSLRNKLIAPYVLTDFAIWNKKVLSYWLSINSTTTDSINKQQNLPTVEILFAPVLQHDCHATDSLKHDKPCLRFAKWSLSNYK